MRVISQSGVFDAPYEQIIVQRNENIVQAISISTGVMIKTLGEYETPEKAEKAMSELKYAFLCNEKIKQDGVENVAIPGEYMEMLIGAFQFPQDNEVQI